MKATLQEVTLHRQVIAGDNLGLLRLYELHGQHVLEVLSKRYPKAARKDDSLIMAAVNEAFFGFNKNPLTFDPEKNTLKRFLEIAAERDLQNMLAKEEKRGKALELPEDVELEGKFWNSIQSSEHDAADTIIHKEVMQAIETELAKYLPLAEDRTIARMILSGERETIMYAEVLGITDQPYPEQQEIVKRVKDRIKNVIQRKAIEAKIKQLLT